MLLLDNDDIIEVKGGVQLVPLTAMETEFCLSRIALGDKYYNYSHAFNENQIRRFAGAKSEE
jgi:hypothetical protein